MYKILANDGIDNQGKSILEKAGVTVVVKKVPQEGLAAELKDFDGIIIRSATKMTADIINAAPHLKFIARAGVGLDNVHVETAKKLGMEVINTPGASSQSVAELVFAHLFGMVRFLPESNRNMPLSGDKEFTALKKKYSEGKELKGKTLGIIGFGRIGQAVAKTGIGIGMKILATDPYVKEVSLEMELFGISEKITVTIKTTSLEDVLKNSDFITLHVPGGKSPVITAKEIIMMKDGVGIVNAARGGVIAETDLLEYLHKGKITYAGLDVFAGEPAPAITLLMEDKLSLTPHIGAATAEAQERIGIELAEKIVEFLGRK